MVSTAPASPAKAPATGRHRARGTARPSVKPAKHATPPPPPPPPKPAKTAPAKAVKTTPAGRGGGRVRKAAAGAASKASKGAVSAATGAAAGLVTGGKRSGRYGSGDPSRRWIVAEFIICAIITALSPITDKHKDDSPTTFTKRSAAVALTFVVIGLIGTGGRGAARFGAALGALVTVSLVISNKDIFVVLSQRLTTDTNEGTAGPPPTEPEGTGDQPPALSAPASAGGIHAPGGGT